MGKKGSDPFSPQITKVEKGNLIRLLEFFMLATSHSKLLDADYRKQEFVVYDVPVIKNEDLVFDLGAFFFNLTRIKRCYQRFRRIVTMP